ncbi:MAG: helix-turn-helix transcriptional regulator [Burkholderiales bacterium]|nr:helix-turn-helix transcriptional regulator [Burkholderiales bacterium]
MRAAIEHVTHPDSSFRLLDLELPAFSAGPHRHPQLELTWIERGNGLRFVGDSVEPFEDGDLVLVGPQLAHAWLGQPASGATPATFRATVLQFSPELLEDARWPELRALRTLLASARRGLAFSPGAPRDRIAALLSAMPAQDGLARLASWVLLMREIAAPGTEARSLSVREAAEIARDDRIERLLAWLHANLAEPIRIEQAAAQVHISPAALPRFFRRETGKTLVTYLNDLRVSEACVQLRQSRRPIADIAAACGFASAAHFDRQFKRWLGCSPRVYRASI